MTNATALLCRKTISSYFCISHKLFPRCTSHISTLKNSIQRRNKISVSTINQNKTNVKNIPPLPVRIALVSSSTALCTPLFPAIGFVNLCLRYTVPNEIRTKLSASIGSILSIACWSIIPFSYNISPLLLPFALSNGIGAGVGYALLDVGTGGLTSSSFLSNKILKHPFVMGGGIGAFTGYVAPNYLYGEAYYMLYGMDNVTPLMKQIMSFPFVTELSCTTGFIAGCAMYPLLHYPMFGIPNVPWVNFAGVLLFSSSALMYGIYSIDGDKHGVIAPDGAYVKPELVPTINSILRFNVRKNVFETYSLTSNNWLGNTDCYFQGQFIAMSVRDFQYGKDSWGEKYTFDNPVLAYLCYWFDRGIAERFPNNVVLVKDRKEIQRSCDVMHMTDLSLAFMVARNEGNQNILMEKVHLFLVKIKQKMKNRDCQRLINSTQKASYGVELIMIMKQKDIQEIHLDQSKSTVSIANIESWIRKTAPGIILFKADENDGFIGMSVESQLLNSSLLYNNEDLESARANWEQIISDEDRTRKRYTLAFMTGLITTLVSGFMLST